jgi:tight adherence protein C
MVILIPVALFALLMLAISFVGYRYYTRPARFYEHLGTTIVAGRGAVGTAAPTGDGFAVRIIRQIGEAVPVSPEDVSTTRRYLLAAGYRSETAVYVIYGLKIIGCICFLALGLYFKSYIPVLPLMQLILAIGIGAFGYFAPGLVLERLVAGRQETIKFSLPDALDLMVVCVEAGLGLDQAILKVSEELELTHPEISEEFRLVTLEMQAGKRRADALRNLAERTGESELRKLIAILIQTDRFGTSIAESLRTHSDFLRVRRRQEAEERANKVGVKLVFPIFFCILPSMLIVVGGPGILQLFKGLFPMMQQFQQGM